MFVVDEATLAAVRAAFQESGEFGAAVELRRRFPGVEDLGHAREVVRILLGWRPVDSPTVRSGHHDRD